VACLLLCKLKRLHRLSPLLAHTQLFLSEAYGSSDTSEKKTFPRSTLVPRQFSNSFEREKGNIIQKDISTTVKKQKKPHQNNKHFKTWH